MILLLSFIILIFCDSSLSGKQWFLWYKNAKLSFRYFFYEFRHDFWHGIVGELGKGNHNLVVDGVRKRPDGFDVKIRMDNLMGQSFSEAEVRHTESTIIPVSFNERELVHVLPDVRISAAVYNCFIVRYIDDIMKVTMLLSRFFSLDGQCVSELIVECIAF